MQKNLLVFLVGWQKNKGFFSSLWSGQGKVQPLLPDIKGPPKATVNRYLVINNNPEPKNPAASTKEERLPPLIKTKRM